MNKEITYYICRNCGCNFQLIGERTGVTKQFCDRLCQKRFKGISSYRYINS